MSRRMTCAPSSAFKILKSGKNKEKAQSISLSNNESSTEKCLFCKNEQEEKLEKKDDKNGGEDKKNADVKIDNTQPKVVSDKCDPNEAAQNNCVAESHDYENINKAALNMLLRHYMQQQNEIADSDKLSEQTVEKIKRLVDKD